MYQVVVKILYFEDIRRSNCDFEYS